MTDDKDKGARQEVPRSADSRQGRLKLKLRENLKRRKVQERARSKVSDAPSADREHDPEPEGRTSAKRVAALRDGHAQTETEKPDDETSSRASAPIKPP